MAIINNENGFVYSDESSQNTVVSLEFDGWFSEHPRLSIQVGTLEVGVELTKKELKALKKQAKALLDEYED